MRRPRGKVEMDAVWCMRVRRGVAKEKHQLRRDERATNTMRKGSGNSNRFIWISEMTKACALFDLFNFVESDSRLEISRAPMQCGYEQKSDCPFVLRITNCVMSSILIFTMTPADRIHVLALPRVVNLASS